MKVISEINDDSLSLAKKIILSDGLVAFPTETVYGLGANAFSDNAIRAVYAAKGRPLDNPLIVHVPPEYDFEELVYDVPVAKKFREAFLPGPLTMVYRSRGKVSPLVSCGLDTLAVRVPSHEGAQSFLRFVGVPIAAPSANVSKHTSPVTAEHVYADFGDNIPLILDGGRCEGGIESTVLDVTGEIPVILRKGIITAEMIKSVAGQCEYAAENSALNARSPGTKYRHYAPKTQTAIFEPTELDKALKLYSECEKNGKTPFVMCLDYIARDLGKNYNVFNLGRSGKEASARLYYMLREAEERADLLIGVEPIGGEDMLGVKNRFDKAFGQNS